MSVESGELKITHLLCDAENIENLTFIVDDTRFPAVRIHCGDNIVCMCGPHSCKKEKEAAHRPPTWVDKGGFFSVDSP